MLSPANRSERFTETRNKLPVQIGLTNNSPHFCLRPALSNRLGDADNGLAAWLPRHALPSSSSPLFQVYITTVRSFTNLEYCCTNHSLQNKDFGKSNTINRVQVATAPPCLELKIDFLSLHGDEIT